MTTSYTLSQYKSWVLNRLDDQSFESGILTQFANDTNREICHLDEWPFMETTFDGTITPGTISYLLPTDYETGLDLTVISPDSNATVLEYEDYRLVDKKYPNAIDQAQRPPTIWSSFGTQFLVGPYPPDQAYTLQLRYIMQPVSLSEESDTLNIPDAFSEVVVLGMYRRALRFNDQFDEAQMVDMDFGAALSLMKQRLLLRQTGINRRISSGRTSHDRVGW